MLWTIPSRHAILTGEFDLRIGLPHLDEDRRQLCSQRVALAEGARFADFTDTIDEVFAVL